ncbi:pyridoxamine kinase [Bacillota bacterium LX-D]|nr:pyridoxamine kinase [Bacillota bacterium LX-D]
MNKLIPKVAALHDLSGFGRCSLTVIIPVLSSLGIQVCPLPTAILSTHSGGFGEFYFQDFTDHMKDYAFHWKSIGLDFECIYSGFLGSAKQIDIVLELFKEFKSKDKQLLVVDPVMGDYGKLYKTYTLEMQKKMRLLVKEANVITPNLTEACFLLEEPYTEKAFSQPKLKYFLKKLSEMGPDTVIITSIKTENGRFENIGYKRSEDTYWKVAYDYVPAHYPGTGDIFTSVLIGNLLMEDNLPTAMDKATQFVSIAVRTTYDYGTPVREGVLLEKILVQLKNEHLSSNYEIID